LLRGADPEGKVIGEAPCVSLHRLVERAGRGAVELSEILVEHHALTAQNVDPLSDAPARSDRTPLSACLLHIVF